MNAWRAMNRALAPINGTLWLISAEWFLLEVWKGYFNTYTTEPAIAARVERQLAPMRAKLADRKSAFDSGCRTFFFIDKHPELAERFVMNFERCYEEATIAWGINHELL